MEATTHMKRRGRDTADARLGVCLLCEHQITIAEPDAIEDDFFVHFEEVHQSGEPMFTITDSDADAE